MNNYNNLINKPLVNGKELIGNISILSLPPVTTSDVGKVMMVNENGEWTAEEPPKTSGNPFNVRTDYNINTNMEVNAND